MAIFLGHARVDRKVSWRPAARQAMLDAHRSGFAHFRQTIGPQPAAEPASLYQYLAVIERREVAIERNDIGLNRKAAGARRLEHQIESGHVAGGDGLPGNDA